MALDFWGALRRMVTLPKAKNSVSDIFGADYGDYLRKVLEPVADEIAAQTLDVLGKGIFSVVGIVDRTKRDLVFEMERVLGRPVAEKVEAEIDRALSDALRKLPSDAEGMQRAIRDALLRALKL